MFSSWQDFVCECFVLKAALQTDKCTACVHFSAAGKRQLDARSCQLSSFSSESGGPTFEDLFVKFG